MNKKKPIYHITLKDNDITHAIADRLISMRITDMNGIDADSIEIELADSDGLLDLPRRGVELNVAVGWEFDSGLVYNNIFTIDSVSHSGAPDVVNICGSSADLRETFVAKREQSYNKMTLAQIAEKIAKRNEMKIKVSDSLKSQYFKHIDQTNESDASFLTRIVTEAGGALMVKNNILLIFKAGLGKSVTGEPLPVMELTRQLGDSHTFTITDRLAFSAVKARWHDYKTGKTESIMNKEAQEKADNAKKKKGKEDYFSGEEDNIRVLSQIYANREEAERAAESAWKKVKRGVCTLSLKLADARPDLFPEMPVTVSGFKQEIDSAWWVITRCVHQLSSSGFTTQLELELKDVE